MEKRIKEVLEQSYRDLEQAEDFDDLEKLRVRYLGRKGIVAQLFRDLGGLNKEKRPIVGKLLNETKASIEKKFAKVIKTKKERNIQKERLDVTLPGRRLPIGRLHPITQITREIGSIFQRLGFDIVEGPEVELDYYNFEALNIPKEHPARDMQDTFYISDNVVLRTHTSPIQVRIMEQLTPPLRVIAPGKTYRRDSDLTHTPMFHQVEGLMVGENISFGHLKGILTVFVHQMFGDDIALRFRPSFFPFTEPSAEVDIRCVICKGSGCRVCSHTGWLEILGSGMVDPEVFKMVGYDPETVSGFAFGMGIERIAMLKLGIDDLRLFFENDLRFLRQF